MEQEIMKSDVPVVKFEEVETIIAEQRKTLTVEDKSLRRSINLEEVELIDSSKGYAYLECTHNGGLLATIASEKRDEILRALSDRVGIDLTKVTQNRPLKLGYLTGKLTEPELKRLSKSRHQKLSGPRLHPIKERLILAEDVQPIIEELLPVSQQEQLLLSNEILRHFSDLDPHFYLSQYGSDARSGISRRSTQLSVKTKNKRNLYSRFVRAKKADANDIARAKRKGIAEDKVIRRFLRPDITWNEFIQAKDEEKNKLWPEWNQPQSIGRPSLASNATRKLIVEDQKPVDTTLTETPPTNQTVSPSDELSKGSEEKEEEDRQLRPLLADPDVTEFEPMLTKRRRDKFIPEKEPTPEKLPPKKIVIQKVIYKKIPHPNSVEIKKLKPVFEEVFQMFDKLLSKISKKKGRAKYTNKVHSLEAKMNRLIHK
eukprot:TRINITY_DN5077_c0_g1_i2.p1 TRINITY_DN5077_c0_g1~~TRINITY_DN5077_c0_g1_i2.p1  ORF type:complete len:428 (-),score=71.47 TRINITY_DN5077_c0_g1_i2:34-1317(-)